MLGSLRRRSRLLAGATLVALAGITPLQAAPGATPPAAAVDDDACGVVLPKGDGTSWTCSFVDEFNGQALDPDKWIVQQTALTGFRVDSTCLTASERNIRVRDGELELIARDHGTAFDCRNPLGSFVTRYTGGMVGTRGRFSQTYGLFEIRARFPGTTAPGLHGGFWMYPLSQTYGAWPRSGEIDVAEWWSADPTLALPSLHYPGRVFQADSGWGCRVSDPENFHTYTVLWLPSGFRFGIDGSVCWTRALDPTDPAPFDHPFSMILNMGAGTTSGVNAVSSSTRFPATFEVDYAKAWR